MKTVSIVGLELAKRVFQVHPARADGGFVLRKNYLARSCAGFLSESFELYRCDRNICDRPLLGSRDWERGHEVRLLPPAL